MSSKSKIRHVAFLTSGGDAPGMNACIRAIVKSLNYYNKRAFAIRDGFKGLLNGDLFEMSEAEVELIGHRGGTVIGSARCKEFFDGSFRVKAIEHLRRLEIDALIVLGGDGSFAGANRLSGEMNIPVIGIPATIDNDIFGSERTIGYDSALNTVVEAVDKIRDTALSHHRTFLIEVMGKNSGYIALNAALAAGVNTVLIPEKHSKMSEIVTRIQMNHENNLSSIVLVAEGDEFGRVGNLKKELQEALPHIEFRSTVLGHLQRGGSPSAFDRILATKMGVFAVDCLMSSKGNVMVASKGDHLFTIPLSDILNGQSHLLSGENEKIIKKLLSTN